jgi:2-polyprenyl-6-methoxyphenol hydroxylase-like FAD-dependent oxidoreductase
MLTTTGNTPYDAIVVGARCAGAPTALLLARAGHRVLLVDRAGFPSDTLSTHVVHAPGVAALRRWGLLGAVTATGCPAIDRYVFDFGPFTLTGTPPPVGGGSAAYAPRRYLLDTILLRAAEAAGAEVREHFSVDDVVVEDGSVVGIRGHAAGGRPVVERARVVVGADGRRSRVARAVAAEEYLGKPPLQWGYYTYWRDLPLDGFRVVAQAGRGWASIPTNEGLTLVVVGRPIGEAAAFRADVEGTYLHTFDPLPEWRERIRAATRVAPFRGGAVPNFFRRPYGPGWALVGDAGYTKDPITAQGMSDAFHDAELCATALDAVFRGERPFGEAMAGYQAARDARVLPIYGFTTQLATLEPPPPEVQQLLAAAAAAPATSDAFAGVFAGSVSPAEFFAPENVAAILGGRAA